MNSYVYAVINLDFPLHHQCHCLMSACRHAETGASDADTDMSIILPRRGYELSTQSYKHPCV